MAPFRRAWLPSALAALLVASCAANSPASVTVPVPSSLPAAEPSSVSSGSAEPLVALPAPFDPSVTSVALRQIAAGFREPTAVVAAPDGSGRLFVVERRGTIRIVKNGQVLPPEFLDLRPLVGSGSPEQGLLGLAFHPRYAENGRFYVNYTDVHGDTVVARYTVSANRDVADPGTGAVVLWVDQPFANHNGGNLVFGPDGYLWIGLGDGGSANDPQGNGQNSRALLGKMLRLDVDGAEPYAIPGDNPFADGQQGLPEIWAMGLRNPWRYSFDRLTGDLYIGDVGQGTWEEVDFEPVGSGGGLNYGWNRMEGSHCLRAARCDQTGLVLPIAEYDHGSGCSVTGGYVYRGAAYPALEGAYFFADYCSGRIWALAPAPNGGWTQTEVLRTSHQISSFGEDEAGELYLLDLAGGGGLYQLVSS